jgi:Uma2 family endonuclease
MTATAAAPSIRQRYFEISLDQYQQMIESGILTEAHKVELILGQIIEKMPVTSEHAATVRKLRRYFSDRFGKQYEITSENPVALPNNSQPEPDCLIAVFREDFYVNQHPTPPEIFVIIEVAKSTLYTDRYLKAAAYAGAGIKEYWIVNLVDRQLEIHLNPNLETSTYANVSQYGVGQQFESPFVGDVAVDDLLPA